ncbi:hypothetical protein DL546_006597 [Coniochaeta pulveracea]|uniref:Uncharacterized protein n=1 Tax=Coniochaeta pulveracea TaxID=177199 RepID=A0A420YGI0_9PEZI|nr:hypothetical protein DL546_006597 [Coniochaeta pulveracea]
MQAAWDIQTRGSNQQSAHRVCFTGPRNIEKPVLSSNLFTTIQLIIWTKLGPLRASLDGVAAVLQARKIICQPQDDMRRGKRPVLLLYSTVLPCIIVLSHLISSFPFLGMTS